MRPKVFRNRHRPLQQTWLASCTDLKFSLDRLRTPNTIHKEVSLLSVGPQQSQTACTHSAYSSINICPFTNEKRKYLGLGGRPLIFLILKSGTTFNPFS